MQKDARKENQRSKKQISHDITVEIARYLSTGAEIETCKPQREPRHRYLASESAKFSAKWKRVRPITFKEYWELHGARFLIDQYVLYYRLPDAAQLNYNNSMLYSQAYKSHSRVPVISHEALSKIEDVVVRLKIILPNEHECFCMHVLQGRAYDQVADCLGIPISAVSSAVHSSIGFITGSLSEFFGK